MGSKVLSISRATFEFSRWYFGVCLFKIMQIKRCTKLRVLFIHISGFVLRTCALRLRFNVLFRWFKCVCRWRMYNLLFCVVSYTPLRLFPPSLVSCRRYYFPLTAWLWEVSPPREFAEFFGACLLLLLSRGCLGMAPPFPF